MSLFRIREWWSTKLGTDEEFDGCLMCVAPVLNSSENLRDQIIVGSHCGIVRIFDPAGKLADGEADSIEFRAEHLLLEKQLEFPIVQVEAGRFVSASDTLHLAILHPRKLSVFALLDSASGQIEHGNHYDLQKIYEHTLQRHAFNFVCGPFGGVKGKDFFCIQSLDGTLSFYEQENFAFTRFLPGSLLPGPLAYVSMSDSFVTVSSSWHLESFKYQMLAVAADSQSKEEAASVTTGKRVAPDWRVQVGEEAVNLAVIEMSPAQPSVFVLGPRSMFCFTEGGTIRFMKKLDYLPARLLAYCATSEGYIQVMVATHTNTVLFYSDTCLRWAAQLPFVPVTIARTKFSGNLRGILTVLDESGHLICGYLGTDPALFGIPQTDFRYVDFQDKQIELKRLQAVIKTNNKAIDLKLSGGKSEDLTITCHIPPKLDDISTAYDSECGDDNVPSTTVRIVLTGKVPLENVQIFVWTCPPVVAHQNSFSFSTLNGRQELPITFFVRYNMVPSSMDVSFQATYAVSGGGKKIVHCNGQLPLQLYCRPCSPSKSSLHKITIDSSKQTVNLNDIFTEFVMSGMDGAIQSMGFQLFGVSTPSVSILVSKNSQKYRVQSESLEALWVFMKELIARLDRYHAGISDYRLSFSGSLPLAEYFALLDHHFELQRREEKLSEVLAKRCCQLRAVQRQLLSKFRDTTPTPLAHLDGLLEMTHRQVLNLADAVQELLSQLKATRSALKAGTEMLLCLLKLQNALSKEECEKLEAALNSNVEEYPDQSWEERTDAAITHILQVLSKGHAAASPTNQNLPKMTDTTRLKKHIALLCDKLSKGAGHQLSPEPVTQPNHKPLPHKPLVNNTRGPSVRPKLETIVEDTNITDITDETLGEGDVPAGSAFGTLASGSLGSKIGGELDEESFEDSRNPENISTTSAPADYLLSEEPSLKVDLPSEILRTSKAHDMKITKATAELNDLPENVGSDVPDLDELDRIENDERAANSPDELANGF